MESQEIVKDQSTHSEEFARERLANSPLFFDSYEYSVIVHKPRTNSIIVFDSNATD